MKIEIWSDIACPYCYIASARLARAIESFEHKSSVEVVLKSYELEPDIAVNSGESQHNAVIRKYRQNSMGAQNILDQAAHAANQSGLIINWDKVITTNTFNAHRLVHFAGQFGKAKEVEERLFRAYFEEGRHVGEKQVLLTIAVELGLDAEKLFTGELFEEDVRRDEQEARALGIRSVPYMLFDEKFAVNGARSEEDFSAMLVEFEQEAIKCGIRKLPESPGCDDGSCRV